ncbi:hypothetical protein O181_038667 [Austropuccinia psidii MF-1]|uniref:Uncharacterized protein n=1 Tax=Austropuccinia psidii MF-1 TaxID=1389203 RepID=A0A9Q3DBD1_9BASI|nr:hypothetical protein [Austropuccinia psidii MF-1]
MYQKASEALAASLSRSGQIKPSRPSPPMPSIPMCHIHDGTEPEFPPPGKHDRKTNVSQNSSTSILPCSSLDDLPETKPVSSCDKSPTATAPSSSFVQTPVDLEHTDNVSLSHMENYPSIHNLASQCLPQRARLKANYHLLLSQNSPNTQSDSEGPPYQFNNPTKSHTSSPTYIPHNPIESTSAVPYNPVASTLAVPFDSISDPSIPTHPSQTFDSIRNSPHQPAAPRDLDSLPSIPSCQDGISAPTNHHCSANLQEVVGALEHFTNNASEQNSKIVHCMDLIVDKLSAIDFNPLPFTNSSTPSASPHGRAKSSYKPRGGLLCIMIQQHCATLIGTPDYSIPPPTTPEERAHWNIITDPKIKSDSSEEDDHPDLPLCDPQFPYPGGPGHCEASQQTFKIIWQAMCQAGMQSFQPSLGKPLTMPENRFHCTFSFKPFLKLVSCGKYEGINLNITNEKFIWHALQNHVQN